MRIWKCLLDGLRLLFYGEELPLLGGDDVSSSTVRSYRYWSDPAPPANPTPKVSSSTVRSYRYWSRPAIRTQSDRPRLLFYGEELPLLGVVAPLINFAHVLSPLLR
jgi:hypothetical protein